ncbi:alpha/beta fold hydrolase [Nonomuraea spiralis]|uniref:alpha/beta fold hydrolase n=1 Tax=Nonomuraea TaxID=83681 RepID=UPI000F766E88|nr:alpha/beta hydrolase [Nonomuraea sp. WAC 01424]RSN06498.1 alpha/beta hydrolase [Nonomuraea sp. WAC 01424]
MTIWYEEAGTGDPVVLLHSTAADSGMWDGVWQELTARHRVIRVDFRGYGRTPLRADGPYSDSGDVADLMAELGVERAALVAASGGGMAALELAAAGRATRLVLLNSLAPLTPTPDLRAFWDEENRLLEAGDVAGAAELNVRTLLGPDADDEARGRLLEMQRHALEVQLAAHPGPEQIEHEVDLARIDVPALVVSGVLDLTFFREGARHLAATLPQARLVELDWAGHLPAMERPKEIADLLLDHL